MSRALVLLAEGFEEIETATIVDVLRRADVDVVLAGLDGRDPVVGSREMRWLPDVALSEVEGHLDLVVLPGGVQGTENLAASTAVRKILRDRAKQGELVAALCAAPFVLDQAGVLPRDAYTCYPGFEGRFETPGRRHETVVDAGTVVTSQGPATAMEFALHLVMRLRGQAVAQEVARSLLFTTSVEL